MTHRPCSLAVLALLLLAACDDEEPFPEPPAEPASAECHADADRVHDAFARPEGAVLFHGVPPAPAASRGRDIDTGSRGSSSPRTASRSTTSTSRRPRRRRPSRPSCRCAAPSPAARATAARTATVAAGPTR
ncbi:MAG: hypothetical protein R3B82_28995 [Sandaracinaceae bacterium]